MSAPLPGKLPIALIICVLLLASIGILMLASTGNYATDGTAENMTSLRRQSVYVIIGLVVLLVSAKVDYHLLERFFPYLATATVLLLALCFVPHVGVTRNAESRWVNLGVVQLQPSEAGKFMVAVFLAWWYARRPLQVGTFWKGFALPWLCLAVPILLICCEKDLGTAALIAAFCTVVMFIVGVRIRYLTGMVGLGAILLTLAVRAIPERLERILAFTNLEAFRRGEGLQQWRALIALGSGGLTGRGYGKGVEKMFYMPYAHTDFIFPMIGEEFGLAGSLTVVLLYVGLMIIGMLVAGAARDAFGRILASGIVALIGCQAIVNLGVTTALLPNKGLPLPFISYGGSNLLVFFAMIGILINIHNQGISAVRKSSNLLPGSQLLTPRI